ncbi:MAG: hypothetical protein IJA10_10335 [Lachnospiraceae bacterium]|nr:hypothetical protein [Lachnospiraceae bacterium]
MPTTKQSKTIEKKEIETVEVKETVVEKKKPRTFSQSDVIVCRSVTPGWLGVSGKSGMYYVFSNYGDEAEIEYGDLFALKNKHSRYIYDPLFVIEDEELLENPRWKDVAEFYSDKVYGMDDIEAVLNKPNTTFKSTLKSLPKGLLKAVTVEVSKRIEQGTFDSLKKIKILDEVCGTDFGKMINTVD